LRDVGNLQNCPKIGLNSKMGRSKRQPGSLALSSIFWIRLAIREDR
jgi:hypothetical protein